MKHKHLLSNFICIF